MDVLREVLVVSTGIVLMVVVWACLRDMAPAWWLVTLVVAIVLLLFFYRTQYMLPIPYRVHDAIMGVLIVTVWALIMILLLSVIGILPVTFNFQ